MGAYGSGHAGECSFRVAEDIIESQLKNPVLWTDCGRPSTYQCEICGRYYCPTHALQHGERIGKERTDAD